LIERAEEPVKIVKILAIVLGVYVAIVALFETWLGYSQPAGGDRIVITTTDDDGTRKDRVVRRLESGGKLYVAVNHWPRAWYNHVRERPELDVTADGEKKAYRAVPVEGEEFDRVTAEYPLGPMLRFLSGFPPRRLVRLDPVAAS
jgi:hypothetical protein